MKRIFMVLAVAAVMAMMLVATAAPAFARLPVGGSDKGVGDEAKGLNNPKCETSVDTTTGDEIVLCPPGAGTFHPRPIR